MDSIKLEEWQRQALLVEYQACQQEANAAGSYGWQSGIIFFVTTLTLAGAVVTGVFRMETTWYRFLLINTLGIFSIASLFAWKMYCNRERFIRRVVYDRMRMIETILGMRKNLYVDFLDHATDKNWKS